MITKRELQRQIDELHGRISMLEHGNKVIDVGPFPNYCPYGERTLSVRELFKTVKELARRAGYEMFWDYGTQAGFTLITTPKAKTK
jgi:hypothetical protein